MNGSANGREKKERKRKLPTFDFRFDTAFTLRRQPPNSPASTTVSQRIRSESCFFVLLLLFFGLIKALLIVVPVTLLHVIPFTLIALFYLPFNIFWSFYSVYTTPKLGCNITFLTLIFLPIPLFLWPILVAIGSTIFGVGFGMIQPIIDTFDPQYNLLTGGISNTFGDSCAHIDQFVFYNQYFLQQLKELREPWTSDASDGTDLDMESACHTTEPPFDITPCELVVGLFVTVTNCVLVGVLYIIISVVKLLPFTIALYVVLWMFYCSPELTGVWKVVAFPAILAAHLFIPIIAVFVVMFCCVAGFFIGAVAGLEGYINGGFVMSYINALSYAAWFDSYSNSLCFNRAPFYTCAWCVRCCTVESAPNSSASAALNFD